MSRCVALVLAACLVAAPSVSEAAPSTLTLVHTDSAGISQCAELLIGADGGAPVQLERKTAVSSRDVVELALNDSAMALVPVGFLQPLMPGLSEIARPFVFRDLAHLYAFSRSALFEQEAARARGVRPLALVYVGTSYVMGTKALRTPDDFEGIAISASLPSLELMRPWGAYVLRESLREAVTRMKAEGGVPASAVAATPIDAVRWGVSEAARYLTRIEISHYSVILAVTSSVWDEMDAPRREALSAWAKKAANGCSARNFDAETRAIEVLKGQGVRVIEPDRGAFERRRPEPEGIESDDGKAFIRRIQQLR